MTTKKTKNRTSSLTTKKLPEYENKILILSVSVEKGTDPKKLLQASSCVLFDSYAGAPPMTGAVVGLLDAPTPKQGINFTLEVAK